MTRSELVDALARRQSVSRVLAEAAVDGLFGSIQAAMEAGARVEIRGFGSFSPRQYPGYTGRNPRTGEKVEVRPKVLPFFKVGKELKERIEAGNP